MDLNERYIRQTSLPEIGSEGQARLAQSSVLVIGAGGLGSPVLLYLAAMGIGRIGFMDHDKVGLSNLQRQILYTTHHVGQPKVVEAHKQLSALNPHICLEPIRDTFAPDNATEVVARYDIVVDACDNYTTRLLADEVTAQASKPFVYGSVEGFMGQVSVFNHNGAGRYRDFAGTPTEASYSVSVPGALPGIIGSVQAMEVLKIIVGCGEPLIGRLLTIDTLHNDYCIYTL